MWYCVNKSEKSHNRICYSFVGAFRSRIRAYIIAKYFQMKEENKEIEYWTKESVVHPDPNFKQYLCPVCGNKMSSRELDKTWDWAGPHCDKCGCTGMEMFSSVMRDTPVMSGKGVFLEKLRRIVGD